MGMGSGMWLVLVGLSPGLGHADLVSFSWQLFIGTLLFTILVFLLPTTALYYLVFTLVSEHHAPWVCGAWHLAHGPCPQCLEGSLPALAASGHPWAGHLPLQAMWGVTVLDSGQCVLGPGASRGPMLGGHHLLLWDMQLGAWRPGPMVGGSWWWSPLSAWRGVEAHRQKEGHGTQVAQAKGQWHVPWIRVPSPLTRGRADCSPPTASLPPRV